MMSLLTSCVVLLLLQGVFLTQAQDCANGQCLSICLSFNLSVCLSFHLSACLFFINHCTKLVPCLLLASPPPPLNPLCSSWLSITESRKNVFLLSFLSYAAFTFIRLSLLCPTLVVSGNFEGGLTLAACRLGGAFALYGFLLHMHTYV